MCLHDSNSRISFQQNTVAHLGDALMSDFWLLVSPWIWWLSRKFWFLVVPVISVVASDSLLKHALNSCRGFRNPLKVSAHPQGGLQGGHPSPDCPGNLCGMRLNVGCAVLAAAGQETPSLSLFLCAAFGTCRTVLADSLVSPAKTCVFPFPALAFCGIRAADRLPAHRG